MFSNTVFRSKWAFALSAIAVTLIIALIYWPVAHAQFIFDDILDFQKMAWLRHGDEWKHLLFRRFNDWINYFRPLGVALFTLEVRLFDSKPGPMHLVSLALHLINTLLVGWLAMQISGKTSRPNKALWVFTVPMLLYGLHPVLVEPVVWIGCQFELMATLFMLLGWIANTRIQYSALRATTIASCFFLAACSKESAFAFPFIIAALDWYMRPAPRGTKFTQIRTIFVENWVTYSAIFGAGIAYLALRHWSLGALIPSNGTRPLPFWAHLQEASFIYLHYWGMFFWPSIGMGPMHAFSTQQFLSIEPKLALQDLAAGGILLLGIWLTLRRHYAGGLILSVTFALLPVLHLAGPSFDVSLYHERYAMTALAVAFAWLPTVISNIPCSAHLVRILRPIGLIIFAIWLVLAVLTIRVTVPLWSNQVKLWEWALEENPSYVVAKDELIGAYIDRGSYASAWALINEIVKNNERCMNCLLNAASLSVKQGNPQQASFFLRKIKDLPELYTSAASYRFYLTTIGQMELLEGHLKEAEGASRAAIAVDKLDPEPQLVLATTLILQGRVAEAQAAENAAVTLLPQDEQPIQRQKFKGLLDSHH